MKVIINLEVCWLSILKIYFHLIKSCTQYDGTAKSLEDSRKEVETWMNANSVLQALKTKVEEALEEKVQEILAHEKMIEELNGDLDVLRDDIAKANAIANAKDSELAGPNYFYEWSSHVLQILIMAMCR